MYINLNDLICYMESYSNAYFCLEQYECYYENELLSEKSSYLTIPKINEATMIKVFIEQANKLELNKLLKEQLNLLNNFHRQINVLDIYEEWIDFRTEYYLKVAAQWCKVNDIKFTAKVRHK